VMSYLKGGSGKCDKGQEGVNFSLKSSDIIYGLPLWQRVKRTYFLNALFIFVRKTMSKILHLWNWKYWSCIDINDFFSRDMWVGV